jgi:hypothetical protein
MAAIQPSPSPPCARVHRFAQQLQGTHPRDHLYSRPPLSFPAQELQGTPPGTADLAELNHYAGVDAFLRGIGYEGRCARGVGTCLGGGGGVGGSCERGLTPIFGTSDRRTAHRGVGARVRARVGVRVRGLLIPAHRPQPTPFTTAIAAAPSTLTTASVQPCDLRSPSPPARPCIFRYGRKSRDGSEWPSVQIGNAVYWRTDTFEYLEHRVVPLSKV